MEEVVAESHQHFDKELLLVRQPFQSDTGTQSVIGPRQKTTPDLRPKVNRHGFQQFNACKIHRPALKKTTDLPRPRMPCFSNPIMSHFGAGGNIQSPRLSEKTGCCQNSCSQRPTQFSRVRFGQLRIIDPFCDATTTEDNMRGQAFAENRLSSHVEVASELWYVFARPYQTCRNPA